MGQRRRTRAAVVAGLVLALTTAAVGIAGATLVAEPPARPDARTRFGSPHTLCRLHGPDLAEVSGAVADGSGFWVVNDGSVPTLHLLDSQCAVESSVSLRRVQVIDVEDLAQGPDGTFWLADIGGNQKPRDIVSLAGLTARGKVRQVRFAYPDGAHDAEALLVTNTDHVVLVTKQADGRSVVYAAPLVIPSPARPVQLLRIGTLAVDRLPGRPGSKLVTGAALSPDGLHVTLRTYTTAYEWEIIEGNVATTLVESAPAAVRLAHQPQGEAITYAGSGQSLVTFSEGVGSPVHALLVRREFANTRPQGDGVPVWAQATWVVGLVLLLGVVIGWRPKRPQG